MSFWRLVRHLARCDERGPAAGLRLFLACLMLGTGVLAALGTMEAALVQGLARHGQAILGGDMQLRLTQRAATPEQRAYLKAQGTLSHSVELAAMAHRADEAALVEVKAVDAAWPLYGEPRLAPAGALAPLLARTGTKDGARYGAVVDAEVLTRLGVELGDTIMVGEAELELRSVLEFEPDRLSGGFAWAPRVLVAAPALAASALLRPGARHDNFYRVRLDDTSPTALAVAQEALYERFPDAGWRVRDRTNASPSLLRALNRLSGFLSLIGLSVLLIAAIGIGSAMVGYLQSRQEQIATMKALGASERVLASLYLWQTLRFIARALAVGLVLGAGVPLIGFWFFADALPLPSAVGFYWQPLVQAAGFGALAAYAFLLPVLGRALAARPALLFRGPLFFGGSARALPIPPLYRAGAILCLGLLLLGAGASVERWLWAVWFLAGMAVAYGLFALLARALIWAAPRRPAGWPLAVRMALANLARPAAPVRSFVASFGIAAALLVAVGLAEANLREQLRADVPARAPAFFFLDVPHQRAAEFGALLRAQDGFEAMEERPILRGRITHLDNVPTAEIPPPPEEAWVLRGDRVIAYTSQPPPDAQLASGEWWSPDYAGAPLVSLDEEVAVAFGLELGDELGVNVLGREITAQIANTRRIDWGRMGMDFVMIFSPEPLRQAPHSFMMTVQVAPEGEGALLRAVLREFPTVTAIRIKDVIARVGNLMGQLALAIRVLALATFLAGLFVLAGALASAHRARLYDAVMSKVVGGTRSQLMSVYALEYGILGASAMALAAVLGTAMAWGVSRFMLELGWAFFAAPLLGALVVIGCGSLILGLWGTARALAVRPARLLRQL